MRPTFVEGGTPPPAPPSERGEGPRPGEPKPDLTISSFTLSGITVTNQGPGPAGPFRLSINGGITVRSPGLLAGGSEDYFAMVDDLEQVAETDEENNTAEAAATIC
jgi:hypothetical protein